MESKQLSAKQKALQMGLHLTLLQHYSNVTSSFVPLLLATKKVHHLDTAHGVKRWKCTTPHKKKFKTVKSVGKILVVMHFSLWIPRIQSKSEWRSLLHNTVAHEESYLEKKILACSFLEHFSWECHARTIYSWDLPSLQITEEALWRITFLMWSWGEKWVVPAGTNTDQWFLLHGNYTVCVSLGQMSQLFWQLCGQI
jgi:hypothetical protein